MGSFSIWHWIILLVPVVVVVVLVNIVRRALGRGSKQETVKVEGKSELLTKMQSYAAQGFQTVVDRGNVVIMSKKQPFNWALGIVLLFIPVIGWIPLLIMLFSKKDKVHSVTIEAPETV